MSELVQVARFECDLELQAQANPGSDAAAYYRYVQGLEKAISASSPGRVREVRLLPGEVSP